MLFLPGSLLTLAGGALFGPLWGTLYNLTGATLGAALAFLIARYLAADWVQTRAGGIGKRLVQGVEAEGWRFVAFTRLVPLFPFNLLNYALGLTRIPFLHYLVATYVFMLPGALAYTWLGYAGREAAAGGEGLIQKGLIALALLAAVAFLPRLIGRLREGPMMQVTGLKASLDAGETPVGARRAHRRRLRRRAGPHPRRPQSAAGGPGRAPRRPGRRTPSAPSPWSAAPTAALPRQRPCWPDAVSPRSMWSRAA